MSIDATEFLERRARAYRSFDTYADAGSLDATVGTKVAVHVEFVTAFERSAKRFHFAYRATHPLGPRDVYEEISDVFLIRSRGARACGAAEAIPQLLVPELGARSVLRLADTTRVTIEGGATVIKGRDARSGPETLVEFDGNGLITRCEWHGQRSHTRIVFRPTAEQLIDWERLPQVGRENARVLSPRRDPTKVAGLATAVSEAITLLRRFDQIRDTSSLDANLMNDLRERLAEIDRFAQGVISSRNRLHPLILAFRDLRLLIESGSDMQSLITGARACLSLAES